METIGNPNKTFMSFQFSPFKHFDWVKITYFGNEKVVRGYFL